MASRIAFIGFGEAGAAFAGAMPADGPRPRAYDLKTGIAECRAAKLEDYRRADVEAAGTAREAVAGAAMVLSLVTADAALDAAREGAAAIDPGTLWIDMNSVAPDTKREAARAIREAGGRYVDAAVMAPVHPRRLAVPLLLSGADAGAAAGLLRAAGFADVRVLGGEVGMASAVKMIRSVMVKGLEALTAECMLAAEAAGVRGEVIASLDAGAPGANWARTADYNLDRMMIHGLRRAAEMEEAARTLAGLGVDALMTRGTIERQRGIGALGLAAPDGLDAKLRLLLGEKA